MGMSHRQFKVSPNMGKGADGQPIPMIKIKTRSGYVYIHYAQARAIVDEVHDLCDAYEREQRTQPVHN